MEGTNAVLVLASQVATNLDGNGRINHTNHGCWETHIRCGATVQSAGSTADVCDETTTNEKRCLTAHQTHVRKEDHGVFDSPEGLLLLINAQWQNLKAHAVMLEVSA